jgi:prepilin-type N-terminal cleavage/methylation domain-containing protein
MKKKISHPARRLPIDFGDEPVFLIPVQKLVNALRTKKVGRGAQAGSLAPIGGEGKGEGATKVHDAAKLQPETLNLKTSRKSYIVNRKSRGGFTLVEILVVLALLSLIVFALMAVFAGTQRAFRASLTQTDTLEGGRAVMDLVSADLEGMIPSGGFTNLNGGLTAAPVNFNSTVKTFPVFASFPPSPLYQPLIGSPSGAMRTNVLEDIFILSKGNVNGVSSWIGTGYSVNTNLADGTLYPLYRFYQTTNATSGSAGQLGLYYQFGLFQYTNSGLWSHLMDGVVNLTARAYDTNGIWMTNGYANPLNVPVQSVLFVQNTYGEVGCVFFSNAVPASVGITLGTVEDHILQHAESLAGLNRSNYLANSVGQVHLFTRRVWIRNLDPAAYQFP